MLIIFLMLNLVLKVALAIPISITAVSNLDFGAAFAGDRRLTISPGNSDNAENASFFVKGDPRRSFSIIVPTEIYMITGTGDVPNKKILVDRFRTRPNQNGRLDRNGEKLILVGARRDNLLANQVAGAYSGSFMITVVY